MTDTRSGTIAIIGERSYDNSNSSREIPLIKYFFYFFLTRIETSSATDSTVDHIDSNSCFFRIRDTFCEEIIFLWIGSFFCCESDEFGMYRIDF